MTGYEGVKRFVRNNPHPDWVFVLRACVDLSKADGTFLGKHVLARAKQLKGGKVWRPGLRHLATNEYHVLEREGGTANRRGAYYSMPDAEGVDLALKELEGE